MTLTPTKGVFECSEGMLEFPALKPTKLALLWSSIPVSHVTSSEALWWWLARLAHRFHGFLSVEGPQNLILKQVTYVACLCVYVRKFYGIFF